ncbi:MAG: 16S rRNA (guanine(966)-N(2))-methyltransferase RsmD [Myxococcales bacterium]|nr:16S rRNA (guanine(966)-N(2))-methyltransferase RsmD [Myxococcales bacterium]
MQRIVAGRLRGRKLRALPAGVEVRPTGSRVREAIFSRLFADVAGARVLDVFAGSGALAFEALSRGASRVVAIDRDARVIRHLEAQAADFGVTGAIELLRGDATSILGRGPGERPPFNLVFVDPPYVEVALVAEVLGALVSRGWLAADADVIVERARIRGHAAPLDLPAGLRVDATRTYGQTAVEFLRGPAPHALQPADDHPSDL